MKNLSVTLAWFWAISFAAAGVMGFVPNPLVGASALFETNLPHNLVHVVTAIAFAAIALTGPRSSTKFMLAFGPIYMLVGALGFVVLAGASHGSLLGVIHLNWLDNYLHVGLGLGILASGLVAANRQESEEAELQSA